MTTAPPGDVDSPVVVTNGGAVMVAWLSVVWVIEMGVEKVDSGVSVTVLVSVLCELIEVPRLVENSVTEAGGDAATGDGLCDTVTEELLGVTTLGAVEASEAVGED